MPSFRLSQMKIHSPERSQQRAASIAIVAFFLTSAVLALPSTVYMTNSSEFSNTYGDLLTAGLVVAIVSALLLLLGLSILKRIGSTAHVRSLAFVFGLGLLVWLQGNFLLWPYGPMDGQDIPWQSMHKYGYIDGSIWVVVLIAALVFAHGVVRMAPRASLILIVAQLVYGVSLIVEQPAMPSFKKYMVDVSDKFVYSTRKNVIILVLDSFQTDVFTELVRESPDLAKAFDGFTHFQNSLSAFPFTELSVASMLTGRYYDNSMPFEQWKERVFTTQSLPSVLKSAGWQVHLFPKVSYSLYFSHAVASNFVEGLPVRERLLDIACVYDISLFRAVPHFLKRAVYNEQQWVFRRWLSGPRRTGISKPAADANTRETRPNRPATPAQSRITFAPTAYASNDVKFVDAALSESRLDDRNNVFKYFHWSVPHVPLILNENLQYEGMDVSRPNYKRYATAGLKLVGMFLDHLRERGIYDESIIFVVGDHGAGVQRQQFVLQPGMPIETGAGVVTEAFKVAANPLILAKPLNSHGPLRISEAPVSLSDIPATAFACLGMPAGVSGSSMFELGEKQGRERMFYRYLERGYYSYYGDMTEFVVNGYGWQDTSWRRSGRVLTKNGVLWRRGPADGADLLFGDLGDFGVECEGFHHIEYSGDTPFHWTDGAASIRVPVEPNRRPTKLSVDVLFSSKPGLRLQMRIDDCEVASETMPGGQWSKDIDVSKCTPTGRWTTIRFLSETGRPGNGDQRQLGVALTRVVLR